MADKRCPCVYVSLSMSVSLDTNTDRDTWTWMLTRADHVAEVLHQQWRTKDVHIHGQGHMDVDTGRFFQLNIFVDLLYSI